MITRRLGKTGFEVSALGMGGFQFTGQFGVLPSEVDHFIDYAIEKGVNFIDTAQLYGGGESEAIVGRALQRHNGADKPIICAKVGHFQGGILRDLPPDKIAAAYFNPAEIIRTIKHSMWVMRVDTLDLLMLHEIERTWGTNYETGDSVGLTVLEELKKDGVVKNIGASSWDCNALAAVAKTGRLDAVLVAGGISLLSRWMFDDLVPACKANDVGIIVGASLGQNTPGLVIKDREAVKPFLEADDAKLNMFATKLLKLYDLSDELGLNMVQMVIRYILSFEDIHSHTMGVRAMEHVVDNIKSAEMGPLPREYVDRINAIQDMGESYTPKQLADMQRLNKLFK